jgi:serine protease Do
LGSGVIVDPAGLVVTNAHVVRGAEEIRIVLSDGREFDAHVSLRDDPSDLALLRVDARGQNLPTARLRPSDDLEVGDLVLAIGNPFGVGQTVTSGIVSALARSSLNISDFNFFIQTDAAINPGNSGGPLVAMDGGVVGINTAIYSQTGGSLGIGFAIPSEMVQSVIAAEANGAQDGRTAVIRPWLGITAQGVTAEIAESLGLDRPNGVLVRGLHAASPLRKAGLKVGDVILNLNGHQLRDPSEMKFRMATVPLGQKADIVYLRKDRQYKASLIATAPPDDPPRQSIALTGGLFTGATVSNINPAVLHELNLGDDPQSGVIVTAIERNTPAQRFLRVGDILLALNGIRIENTRNLERILQTGLGSGVNLVLDRNGQKQSIILR